MNKEDKKLAIAGGVLILAYFGIIRPVLTKIGIFKSAQEKLYESRKATALENEVKATAKTERPTKSEFEWNTIADQIYQDLKFSALDDNKDDATYQAARVKNNADFYMLWKGFGTRQEYAFGIPVGGKKNLQQFIRDNLSDSKIETLNSNYARKGIKFRY